MNKTFYVTTAIDYTSQKPHIGNNYEKVLADAIARYKKLEGFDVYFQTGTDEHGQKVYDNAMKSDLEPIKYVNEISKTVKNASDILDVDYDNFVRTIDKKHKEKVGKIFTYLYEKGDIYLGEYKGWYCIACESFYLEKDLTEKKCPDCGREVTYNSEETYFFKLSKYQDRLVQHIKENPDFIKPESRKKEMMNYFLKNKLEDLAVSRTSVKWGIEVPFDKDHTIYVWIDALSNYITFLGYDVDGNHGKLFEKYWPANLHIVGKDITRFHTIYWPILLMALDVELPKTVLGHPWLTIGGDKISKSSGNTIYADDLLKIFDKDQIRYYLLSSVPYKNDGTLTYDLLIDTINSDLVNNLGNLVSRTNSMMIKYFNGKVPAPEFNEKDEELIEYAENLYPSIKPLMDEYKIAESLKLIMKLFKKANKYIDLNEPWVLAKDLKNKKRLGTVLYTLIESIRIGSILLIPFIPETANNILRKIGTDSSTFDNLTVFGRYEPKSIIFDSSPLFERLNKKEILESLEEEK